MLCEWSDTASTQEGKGAQCFHNRKSVMAHADNFSINPFRRVCDMALCQTQCGATICNAETLLWASGVYLIARLGTLPYKKTNLGNQSSS